MKNYNIFALEGDTNTSDMEVCQTLGLDINLAGKPEINDAAINAMRSQNVKAFMQKGMPAEEATKQANALAAQSHMRVQKALAKQ